MTELITTQSAQLPATLEDLAKFVLVGNDKLQAVRAEISAIKKLGLAKEVHEQKLKEAQDIAEIVMQAKIRIGELLNQLPKADNGGANQYRAPSARLPNKQSSDTSTVETSKVKSKSEVIKDIGLNQTQAERLQQMAKNQDVVQKTMANARENGDIVSQSQILKDIKAVKKAEKSKEREKRKTYTLETELPADTCNLFCADIQGGLPQIEDSSIDFIITDPPYPKEYLPLYEDLSKVAARVLKDGGSLVCMVGQSYLPEVIQLLKTSMQYHWCMCYLTPGATPQLWQKRTNTFWKPLLWFVKGEYKGDWIGNDVLQSPGNDKRFHEWGQSIGGMKDIVERFTNPNDIILDPFLGGGTTAVTSVMTGRKFIGVDVKQECLDITLERVKETYKNGQSCT